MDLVYYYKARAKEYERIYAKPERAAELLKSADVLQELFKEKSLLEIACGTGFWTEKIAVTARSVLATDINGEVLEIAIQKQMGEHVRFEIADFYSISPDRKHENLFGGFIWSHILLQDLEKFLMTIKTLVIRGGSVVFMDNRFVQGSSTPIWSTDESGNTFQRRNLDDGTQHMILKNFPAGDFLINALSKIAGNIRLLELQYFWIVSCEIK